MQTLILQSRNEMVDTFEKIAHIIADKLKIDASTIKPESTLKDLGADSLDLVEIIMKIEEQFDIEIDDEKAEHMKNVAEVVDYVNSMRSK